MFVYFSQLRCFNQDDPMSDVHRASSPGCSEDEARSPSPSRRSLSRSPVQSAWSDDRASPDPQDEDGGNATPPSPVLSEKLKPPLKFGVNAILSSEVSPKNGKSFLTIVTNSHKV